VKLWISAFAVFGFAAISSGPLAATAVAAPPTITSEAVSNLTPTDATLEAEINPQSTERGAWYQFQVATAPGEFRSEFTCPTEGFPAHTSLCLTVPSQPGALPLRWLPPGTEAEPVSLDLASKGMELQPGVTYYWRVIAAGSIQTIDTIEWEKPAVHGTTMSFETPMSGSAPTIESESVSGITEANATLEALIDSGGLPTSYEFHLWPRWNCEPAGCEPPISSVPLPGGELPASASAQPVSLDLNGAGVYLHPALYFYEYWVTATNSAGSAEGPVITFAPEEAGSGEAEWKPPGEWEQEPVPVPAQDGPASAGGPRSVRHARKGCGAHQKHHRAHRRGLRRACVAPA
jgi:hypothetical protein